MNNIQYRILAGFAIASIITQSLLGGGLGIANAAIIGSGTVQWSGALTTNINWNDVFPGTASGTINGIVVTARVLPVLNMTISGSGTIDLWNLSSIAASSGSIQIELGTNAINGASVSARSTNGGLTNTASGSVVINSLTADGFADSYKFITTTGTADSTAAGFTQSGSYNGEISTTTAVTVYSSNKPQPLTNVDDFTFTIAAQPNAQTPAGDYRDIVVITVTGNF